jgi:hypothetical protein
MPWWESKRTPGNWYVRCDRCGQKTTMPRKSRDDLPRLWAQDLDYTHVSCVFCEDKRIWGGVQKEEA